MKTINKSKVLRKDNSRIIDFFMAIINFGVIFIVITFKSFNNLLFYFILLGVSLILLGNMLYIFRKNNPYFVYFCYGLFFCGAFYALPLMFLSYSDNFLDQLFFILGIILILPQIMYIYNLIKGINDISRSIGGYNTIYYQNIGAVARFDENRLNQYLNEKNLQLKMKGQEKEEELKKKYKANRILIVSLSCIIAFFIIAIISAII